MSDLLAVDTLVLPTGATFDDWDDLRYWALHVRWRGPRTDTGRGGWAVTTHSVDQQLSRAGNWALYVEPFQQRQYRWATFDEALAAARAAVDTYTNGRQTWAQFLEWRNARRTDRRDTEYTARDLTEEPR